MEKRVSTIQEFLMYINFGNLILDLSSCPLRRLSTVQVCPFRGVLPYVLYTQYIQCEIISLHIYIYIAYSAAVYSTM